MPGKRCAKDIIMRIRQRCLSKIKTQALVFNKAEELGQVKTQTSVVNVAAEKVKNLRVLLIKIIRAIRKESHYGNEVTGTRQQMTDSFKDILHLLMTAKDSEDHDQLKVILKEAKTIADREVFVDSTGFAALSLKEVRVTGTQAHTPVPISTGQARVGSLLQTATWGMFSYFSTDPKNAFEYRDALFEQGIESGFCKCAAAEDTESQALSKEFSNTVSEFLAP